ncbi:sialate O-acetylesterase [Rhodopirellula sp. MGV]|uniref:sialate O-acetylesterase n=1 Tax=Rhodopirellula sp. MGV TaxID=2023130 RepID=UPI0028F42367|nr:sialate O-acetylesterase [Rhodopirellula sp. MGV]
MAEPVEGCAAEIVMDRALDFIRAKAENDRPFLAVIWFNPPHSPVVGNPRYMAQHYADLPENQQHYYSLATAVDAQMGRLRNTLRELGIADQTLLVFTSDNGPGPPVGRTFKPDARLQGSAGPFRERKASLYEGGIRVPGLIEWPTQIRSGTVIDAPCTTLDYLPTIATLLDIELPRRPFDGIDLMPLLTGAQQERGRPIGFYFRDAIALSDDRFKLIDAKQSRGRGGNDRAFDDRKFELFDLIADPGETTDVSDRHPDIVIAMKSELKTWVASVENSHDGNDYQAGKTRLFLLSGQSNMKNLDPETTFLPTLRKSFPNDTLILVKVAYGGRSISRWVPRGKIYAELLGKAKEAIEKNGTATNDLDSISFVWMQGERDHQQDATTQAYADNLRQLRRQLIDDFGREDISWVIGRLSDARVSTANWDTIRQIQVDFANGNSFAKWVDTDDLNGVNNGVHCPPEGYDEMGKRFATAAIELIQKEETN